MTWPNVLVLEYLRDNDLTNSSVELKARLNIALGYQRMLTFQHPDSGGFSWYGGDPEHLLVTAYGLMELSDMSQVAEVDQSILRNAAGFLAMLQETDGHWEPPQDRPFATGGTISTDTFQATTFVAWAIQTSGQRPDVVQKAVNYLMIHRDDAQTTFAKALLAVFLSEYPGADQSVLSSLRDDLEAAAQVQPDGTLAWPTEGGGSLYDYGDSATLETSALAVLALEHDPAYTQTTTKGLAYLVSQKDALGNFRSTQATVFTFKALLASEPPSVDGTVTVMVEGNQVAQLTITPETTDVFRVVDLKNILAADDNQVELLFAGQGQPSFQVVGLWYVPWSEVPEPQPGPLDLQVDYDQTELQVGDTITVHVTVRNTTDAFLPMVMIDLGTPPGFDPIREDLDALVEQDTIANYEITDRQVIIYTNGLQGQTVLDFSYRIQATMAFSGDGPGNKAYLYYTPAIQAVRIPISVTVQP